MESLTRFIEEYEKLKALYPQIYVNINEFGSNHAWRISVLGVDMAIIGDAELMTVESLDREEAFEKAIRRIKTVPTLICEAMKLKESGRKIVVKRT